MREHLRRTATVCVIVLAAVAFMSSHAFSEVADTGGVPDVSAWSHRVLSERGFVVVPSAATEIPEAYEAIRRDGVHTFITADTVLRTTRLFLDEVLFELENGELYDRLTQLSREMVRLSEDQYLLVRDPTVREAARLNYAYFAVALSLLDPEFFPSEAGLALVERELDLIEEGRVLGFSPIMGASPLDDVAGPGEDYSVYIPVGHYATSDRLSRFHRAVTWYGRMAFALPEGRRSDYRLTIQGILVARALEEEAGAPTSRCCSSVAARVIRRSSTTWRSPTTSSERISNSRYWPTLRPWRCSRNVSVRSRRLTSRRTRCGACGSSRLASFVTPPTSDDLVSASRVGRRPLSV